MQGDVLQHMSNSGQPEILITTKTIVVVSAFQLGGDRITSYMIEVFKTDVTTEIEASVVLGEIHNRYRHCKANFDLSDCDKILRVEGVRGEGDICAILTLVRQQGHQAEVLSDDSSDSGSEFILDLDVAHS